ncbi:diphosphomevalonate decarboxylase [Xylocopilactobacillus apicola]|uniref:diphosphomevalonate decarboxylase n=1 Tax=Xylocopilactobacillus apicola TaxID=2932184 RepID=A0AAU9DMY3_9LACO|nr:diphosphomevalonate decarboxylase [Xylocopilactobacillus apicola]BDR58377.1 diphosphomevalonate decarboxylase [Xylocopilactobacillus apicola]
MARAIAHPNIALIKYWGKADPLINLPAVPSISLTLSELETSTSVTIDPQLNQDVFILNGKETINPKVELMMNAVRKIAKKEVFASIKSSNNFPTSAGYASSASGMAAIALASNQAYELGLDHDGLARLARLGSGSATRSIDGGLVSWPTGTDVSSFGRAILPPEEVPLAVFSVTTTAANKKISSTDAMQIVSSTSPYYPTWVQNSTDDYFKALELIKKSKWEDLLALAQNNALKMHAVNLAARPEIIYWQPESLAIMQQVQKIQTEKQIPVYFSLDAGPNVKLLTLQKWVKEVATEFATWDLQLSLPGKGAQIIDQN